MRDSQDDVPYAQVATSAGESACGLLTASAWAGAIKARDYIFGARNFSDPGWEILLDLYISKSKGRNVCVSDLYLATSAPPTTAHRWIILLENKGLLIRIPDFTDKRRQNVSFTPTGLQKFETALELAGRNDR
jgi:DNA-binding MarR family transcriptional regulator